MTQAGAAPRRAMVLAAGLGLRLRPMTLTRPKPLIEVAGRTLVDHVLDRLAAAGVDSVVVNVHHLGRLVERHLGQRSPGVAISAEPKLLDTGGGVAKALAWLGDKPFYAVNADSLWLDGPEATLRRLAFAFDAAAMDGLLLLAETVFAHGYDGPGDFAVDGLGRLRRRSEREVVPFAFAGVQILAPRLFDGAPSGAFSLNLLYDRALAAGRLFGLVHDGEWFHIGTTDGLKEAERGLTSPPEGPNRR